MFFIGDGPLTALVIMLILGAMLSFRPTVELCYSEGHSQEKISGAFEILGVCIEFGPILLGFLTIKNSL